MIQIRTPFRRYPPVGHCIYCGVYSSQLNKEHILPFGIADDSLVLPKASCRNCEKTTGRLETVCLQHMWWPFRQRIGAPTRGKKPPSEFEMRFIKNAKHEEDGAFSFDQDRILK